MIQVTGKIETKLKDAVMRAIEADRQGDENSTRFLTGKAMALVEAIRLIEANGIDEIGAHIKDEKRLNELWQAEHKRQEDRS